MQKILLATDGSDYSLQSLKKIIPMARALGSKLTILTVAEEVPFLRGTEGMSKDEIEALLGSINREAELGLERARKLFETEGIKVETMIRAGKAAEVICEMAAKGAFDLIVMGDTGRGGLREFLLGSVSNKVVHQAKTDVLIVKRNE